MGFLAPLGLVIFFVLLNGFVEARIPLRAGSNANLCRGHHVEGAQVCSPFYCRLLGSLRAGMQASGSLLHPRRLRARRSLAWAGEQEEQLEMGRSRTSTRRCDCGLSTPWDLHCRAPLEVLAGAGEPKTFPAQRNIRPCTMEQPDRQTCPNKRRLKARCCA